MRGASILVTGANGFIGGRLVEQLVLSHGAKVRTLVRNPLRLARLARFDLDVIVGEVADAAVVERSVAGMDVVFHCAHDFSRSGRRSIAHTRRAVELLARACRRTDARLVHVSTADVYGWPRVGTIDEETPPTPDSRSTYAVAKLGAEEVVRRQSVSGLQAVVLQPTIVYGPYCRPWTLSIVEQLRTGNIAIGGRGEGLCHHIYVDDVIDALVLAATNDAALGETFLVGGAEPVTWSEFYLRFAALVDREDRVHPMRSERIRELWKERSRRGQHIRDLLREPSVREFLAQLPLARRLYRAAQRVIPHEARRYPSSASRPSAHTEQTFLPDPVRIRLHESHARFSTRKAAELLGFEAKFRLDDGMALTSDFLRWADLV